MIGRGLNDLRIRIKVGLIAAVSIAGLAVVGTIYAISEARLAAFQAVVDLAVQHDQVATGAQQRFLEGQLTQRGFAESPNMGLAERTRLEVDGARQGLERMARGGAATAAAAQAVRDDLAAYRRAFDWFVELKQSAGFSATDGQHMAMRSAAQALEASLQEHRDPELTILLLQMRRHEKDFLDRRNPIYIAQFAARQLEFHTRLETSSIGPDRRSELADLAATYQGNFHSLLAGKIDEEIQQAQLAALAARIQIGLREISSAARTRAHELHAQNATERHAAFWLMAVTVLAVAVCLLGLTFRVGLGIVRPLERLTGTMGRLAGGDWNAPVGDTVRRDEVGIMARAVGVLRDTGLVSERNRALRERAEADGERQRIWFKALLENLPIAVTAFDENGRLAFRNAAMNRIHPHPQPGDLVGLTLEELIDTIAGHSPGTVTEGDGSETYGFGPRLARRYRDSREGSFEISFPSGTVVDVQFRWLDEHRLIIAQQDISMRRAAETRAVQAEEFLRDVFDHVPVGISVYDENRRLLIRNKFLNLFVGEGRQEDLIGLTMREIVELAVHGRTSDPAERQQRMTEYAGFLDESIDRFVFVRPDGRIHDVRKLRTKSNRLIIARADVTELHRSEQRAEAAERYLRDIMENLPVGVLLVDKDDRIVLRNTQQNQIFPLPADFSPIGLKFDDIVYRNPLRMLTWPDGQVYEGGALPDRMLRQAYRSPPDGALRVRTDLGRECTVKLRRMPSGDLIVVTADISDLMAARHDAERQERLLKGAIEVLPVGFSLFAKDGTLRLFNRQYLREHRAIADAIRPGMSISEIAGAYWDGCGSLPPPSVDPESWPSVKSDPVARAAFVQRATERLIKLEQFSDDIERDTGVFRTRRVSLATGDVVRISTDITDLRQKEAEIVRLSQSELAQRTAILQEVLDSVPQAIGVLDGERRLKFANRSLSDMLNEARVEGWPILRLLDGVGIEAEPVLRMLRDMHSAHDIEVTSSDRRPLRIRVVPVAAGEALLSISDLTRQRQDEAERLDRQQQLLKAEKSQALVTLVGSIAHDFNNLLAVILGFSSLATARLGKLPVTPDVGPIATALDNVIASAERGRNVVTSLAALTKATGRDAGTGIVDLRGVLRDIESLLRVLVPASARIVLDLPETPCRTMASITQIEQVVTNLVINAVHAIEGRAGQIVMKLDCIDTDGGRAEALMRTETAARRLGWHVELPADGTVSIFAGVLNPGRYVRVLIADDGCGIGEDVARRMFTPFFTTKSPGSGMGLGLISVLEIVDAHGGGVHVRSRLGVGTSFMILLPESGGDSSELAGQFADQTPGRVGDRVASVGTPGAEAEIRREARILVVDDEVRLVELATTILKQTGYKVEGFADSVAAMRRLEMDPHAFDLVMTDQAMPAVTGRDIVDRLQMIRPELPVIVCTGFSGDLERAGGLPASVKAVLNKPYLPAQLVETVRRALATDADR